MTGIWTQQFLILSHKPLHHPHIHSIKAKRIPFSPERHQTKIGWLMSKIVCVFFFINTLSCSSSIFIYCLLFLFSEHPHWCVTNKWGFAMQRQCALPSPKEWWCHQKWGLFPTGSKTGPHTFWWKKKWKYTQQGKKYQI